MFFGASSPDGVAKSSFGSQPTELLQGKQPIGTWRAPWWCTFPSDLGKNPLSVTFVLPGLILWRKILLERQDPPIAASERPDPVYFRVDGGHNCRFYDHGGQ